MFNIYDPFGIKILTSLRLDFNDLHERKFRHGIKDTLITQKQPQEVICKNRCS